MSSEFWAVLPLLAWGGILAWELSIRASAVDAILRATVWWAAGVWLVANGLGYFGWLEPGALRVAWSIAGIALAGYGGTRFFLSRGTMVGQWPCLRGGEWIVGVAGAMILALALTTALVAPPVTVDVLNYHLPRQLMWLQQGSLAHFITVNDRELMMPPLAEVIGLQFLGLTGNDHWVNMPQWVAYAFLPLALGRMARTLGLSRQAALLAGWLSLCLPMAYHEASNAKNDLMGAFWMTLLAWQVVEPLRSKGTVQPNASLVGTILALALLTKSTAFVFAPPLMVAGFWFWCGSSGVGTAMRAGALTGAICLVLVAPFYLRNWAWYGTPLGVHRVEDGGQQANTDVAPALVASNALRNATLHLAGPWPAWNRALRHGVVALHEQVGLSAEDSRNTLWTWPYSVNYKPKDEAQAGAPLTMVGMLLAAGFAFLHPQARKWRWLALSVGTMGLLYCMVVKWQPWGARLQLPVFVLGGLLVAGVTEALPRLRATVLIWIVGFLALLVWWPSREDKSRPLWTDPTIFSTSREANQYRYLPMLRERDHQLASLIRKAGVHSLAIVSIHDITYPLMRLLKREVPEIHFYGAPAADGSTVPDAYAPLEFLKPLPLYFVTTESERYRLVGQGMGDGLYLPVATVRARDWWWQLPKFAGWIDASNFGIGAGVLMPDGSIDGSRFIAGDSGLFRFHAEEDMVYLSAVLVKEKTDDEMIEIMINERLVKSIDLQSTVGFHHFEFSFSCRRGVNLLEIRRIGGKGKLIFTKLVLNDVPPPDPA